jgi:Lrp/AsnC family leucine-responsive transcriptional regulator
MAHKHELDATDRRLLQLLVSDGRASYQTLADQVGLSRPAVMERVKGMEEAGYITGYVARLDRGKTGYPVTAFVAVRFADHRIDGNEPQMRALADHPGVLECHHVAGDDCYILKIAAPNLDGVQTLLRQITSAGAGVTTKTTIVLGTVFEKPGLVPRELD